MKTISRVRDDALLLLVLSTVLVVFGASFLIAPVLADTSPNGPGQPGAPGTTCGSTGATSTPGNSASTNSVFNGNGQASSVYAGNPGTASLANANSPNAVSQYNIACFQNTQAHP